MQAAKRIYSVKTDHPSTAGGRIYKARLWSLPDVLVFTRKRPEGKYPQLYSYSLQYPVTHRTCQHNKYMRRLTDHQPGSKKIHQCLTKSRLKTLHSFRTVGILVPDKSSPEITGVGSGHSNLDWLVVWWEVKGCNI